jgi:beta-lactam-binding protein with PASTA domain
MRPDQDQGFKTTIISLTHPERRGIVFGQNPGAGQDVNKRSTVRLLVSKGLTTVAVLTRSDSPTPRHAIDL